MKLIPIGILLFCVCSFHTAAQTMQLPENHAVNSYEVLRFGVNGKYKIMQVTDTHIIVGSEHSQKSVDMLNTVLDTEKPDLVIFTGDVVTGKPYKAGFDRIIEPVVSRKINWALIFGNHDNEQDMTYEQLATFIESYPFNKGKMQAVDDVSGYGNYTLEINGKDGQKTEAVLYCMDSHSYSSIGHYDWLAFNQVEWYRRLSNRYTDANNGKPLPSLAFFHIPFPEYKEAVNDKIIGMKRMGENPPDVNSGMFLAMLEKGDVIGTFVGHDHANDYIFNHFDIALAYGRFSGNQNTSYSTVVDGVRQRYSIDFPNGVRIIEMTEGQRSFDTWIRLNDNSVINKVKFPDDLK